MYYLEVRDRRGGLLVSVENESVTTCSFSLTTAISFQRRSDARKYLHTNKLHDQFKAVKIQHS